MQIKIILVKKKKKSIRYKKQILRIKNNKALENILNKLVLQYNIECIVKKFNINASWKPVYYSSYYTNAYIKNKNIYIRTYTRGGKRILKLEKIKIPINDNILKIKLLDNYTNKKLKCKVKYDRFRNKLEDVQLIE